jgi:hypothetical protein
MLYDRLITSIPLIAHIVAGYDETRARATLRSVYFRGKSNLQRERAGKKYEESDDGDAI